MIEALDKLDGVSGRFAAQTVEKALGRAYDKRGFGVFVERAASGQLLAAVLIQNDAAASDQGGKVGFATDSLDLLLGYAGHASPFKITSIALWACLIVGKFRHNQAFSDTLSYRGL
jgi:hypothetical protein